MPPFAFLTNHGLTMLCIAEDPKIRTRDIATAIDITERAAQRIVADLVDAGYLTRRRNGRRNEYAIPADLSLLLPRQRDIELGSLLNVLLPAATLVARRDEITGHHPGE